jgi:cellobiose epimerase
LEKYSHDPIYKGYYQYLNRDGSHVMRTADIFSTSDIGYKDQNSSIHILEALTELYKVWKDPLVKERLQEMLDLIRDKIVTPEGYLRMYFTYDWNPFLIAILLMRSLKKIITSTTFLLAMMWRPRT